MEYAPSPGSMAVRRLGLVTGPAAFLYLLFFTELDAERASVSAMAAVAALMAVLWLTEALPLAATALIPLVAFPLLGIAPTREVAGSYVNSTIFLFIGGFLIALAMERWNLHRRIALAIVSRFGGRPAGLVLGFMLATAFLSMWISNTATTIMMVPIGLALILRLEEEFGAERSHRFAVLLMLSIAYAASMGGVATLVGTPPNLSFARIFQISFPAGPEIGFGDWLLLGLPLGLLMLVAGWALLSFVVFRIGPGLRLARDVAVAERRALGPMSPAERSVALVFAATALLWVFRKDLLLGFATIPGWSRLLPEAGLIDDGTVAIAMSLLLFVIPAGRGAPGARLLDQTAFARLPWSIVILFGGGFALARGFSTSGLSEYLAGRFTGLQDTQPAVLVSAVTAGMMALTELTSNTATTEMLLPVLASMAVAIGVNPLLLMVPATLAASFAFMLPVATPPNAIVFGSGRVRMADMVRAGIWMNLLGWVVVTAAVLVLMPIVMPEAGSPVPEWTQQPTRPG